MKYFDKDKAVRDIINWIPNTLNTIKVCPFIKKGEVLNIINNNIHSKPKTKSAAEYKKPDGKYDLPVGTKFIYKGKKYIIKKNVNPTSCPNCDFEFISCHSLTRKLPCNGFYRTDKNYIIFKKIK